MANGNNNKYKNNNLVLWLGLGVGVATLIALGIYLASGPETSTVSPPLGTPVPPAQTVKAVEWEFDLPGYKVVSKSVIAYETYDKYIVEIENVSGSGEAILDFTFLGEGNTVLNTTTNAFTGVPVGQRTVSTTAFEKVLELKKVRVSLNNLSR